MRGARAPRPQENYALRINAFEKPYQHLYSNLSNCKYNNYPKLITLLKLKIWMGLLGTRSNRISIFTESRVSNLSPSS